MWKDPIVEEIRKHRMEIEEECNGDFALLFAEAQKLEKSLKAHLVSGKNKKRKRTKSRITV